MMILVLPRCNENPVMMMMQIKDTEMLLSPMTVQISLLLRDCRTKCLAPRNLVRSWSCTTLPKDERHSNHPILHKGP